MNSQIITREAVRQVLSDYWFQLKTYWKWALIGFLLPAVGTTLIFFIPPLIVARLINIFITQGAISFDSAKGYLVLFGSLWLLGELFWRVGMHFLFKLQARAYSNLGQLAFERLTSRDYSFYADNFVGSLTKKGLAFSRSFEIFTDTLNYNVFSDLIPMIFGLVVLWLYSPWIPLLLIAALLSVIGIALPIIRKRSRLVALRHDASSKVAARLSDSMTNVLSIKSFATEKQELQIFKKYVDTFSLAYKKAADYHNLRLDTLISPLYVATNIFGLIAAIFFTQHLGLAAGTIVVVFSYYAHITRTFWEINRVYRNIESSISEAAEFTQLFITAPAIQDAPNAADLMTTHANIRFDRIHFSYNDQTNHESFLLKNFTLDIKAKQKIGLVGPSGGGKTTITKLILRFIDTHKGTILIDGQNIKEVTQNSLRKAIAYVPQEPLLFHRTLLENIAYGNEKATKKEIIAIAKLARADEFIEKLPHGYQTYVGERGIKLSSGQKQRIAIARALLKSAPILVLDEATSALDSESEKYIQEGLLELLKNKTAIVIAHRLSTIKQLDRIIVLDNGKIVQDGKHSTLIHEKGLYAKLWRHQSGDFLKDE
ncbi:MAG: ABC transporter ATP-binding protein [Patescibacteria group bacterium]|jgi:ATP-binding cassette subfamily B protein